MTRAVARKLSFNFDPFGLGQPLHAEKLSCLRSLCVGAVAQVVAQGGRAEGAV